MDALEKNNFPCACGIIMGLKLSCETDARLGLLVATKS
jgi:hypothetical protein